MKKNKILLFVAINLCFAFAASGQTYEEFLKQRQADFDKFKTSRTVQ